MCVGLERGREHILEHLTTFQSVCEHHARCHASLVPAIRLLFCATPCSSIPATALSAALVTLAWISHNNNTRWRAVTAAPRNHHTCGKHSAQHVAKSQFHLSSHTKAALPRGWPSTREIAPNGVFLPHSRPYAALISGVRLRAGLSDEGDMGHVTGDM